jgi:hypothetical protein
LAFKTPFFEILLKKLFRRQSLDLKRAATLFIILFCCFFLALAQEQIKPEEYEVYQAWLNKAFITPETKQIVIMKFTAGDRDDLNDLKLSQLQSSTRRDYRLRNRKSLELKNYFGVSPIVTLSPEAELASFFHNGLAYKNLAEKFGAEFGIALSRVGFNRKKNQALMHVHYRSHSDPKYTFGCFFLLSKEDGNWTVKRRVMSWVY